MPARKFEVDTDLLCSAGESSGYAGAAARKAATRLEESNAAGAIFGDFDAAHSFRSALSASRDQHVERMRKHVAALSDISAKAPTGAQMVTETAASSAAALNAARDRIDATDA